MPRKQSPSQLAQVRTGMTLSRRSTFPPVLQAYHSGLGPTGGINSFLQTPPQWKAVSRGSAKDSIKKVADRKKNEDSSAGVRLLLRNERQLELKKKAKVNVYTPFYNNSQVTYQETFFCLTLCLTADWYYIHLFCVQRAEGMLKSWDALHQKERDEKCCFLQQKVKLQHDLIAKADQLSEEIRAKAMEEQQEVSGHLALSL